VWAILCETLPDIPSGALLESFVGRPRLFRSKLILKKFVKLLVPGRLHMMIGAMAKAFQLAFVAACFAAVVRGGSYSEETSRYHNSGSKVYSEDSLGRRLKHTPSTRDQPPPPSSKAKAAGEGGGPSAGRPPKSRTGKSAGGGGPGAGSRVAPGSGSSHAAPMLGDGGKTTVGGMDARTKTSFSAGENIYGPFEAGFGSQQDFILEVLEVLLSSRNKSCEAKGPDQGSRYLPWWSQPTCNNRLWSRS